MCTVALVQVCARGTVLFPQYTGSSPPGRGWPVRENDPEHEKALTVPQRTSVFHSPHTLSPHSSQNAHGNQSCAIHPDDTLQGGS